MQKTTAIQLLNEYASVTNAPHVETSIYPTFQEKAIYERLSDFLEKEGFLSTCGETEDGYFIELTHSIEETAYRLENGISADN